MNELLNKLKKLFGVNIFNENKKQLIIILLIVLIQILIRIFPEFRKIGLIILIPLFIVIISEAISSSEGYEFIDKILKITLTIVVCSPLLVYTIILFFHTFPNILIKVGDSSSWISFAGSIISGSLVMFSLIFTLQNDKTVREHQFKLTNLPVIDLFISEGNSYKYERNEPIKFIIQNIGNNHIRNLMVEDMIATVQYQSKSNDFDRGELGKLDIEHFVDLKNGVSLIPTGKTHELCFRLWDPHGYLIQEESTYLAIKTQISYWNVVVNSEFKFESTINFKILRETLENSKSVMFLRFYSSIAFYDPETYAIKETD